MRTLREIIDAMRRLDKDQLFYEEIRIIERTHYRFKLRTDAWPKKATCYGIKKVDLPYDFYRRPFHDQSSTLILMAAHQQQVENHIFYPLYAARYAINQLLHRENNKLNTSPHRRSATWICRIMPARRLMG